MGPVYKCTGGKNNQPHQQPTRAVNVSQSFSLIELDFPQNISECIYDLLGFLKYFFKMLNFNESTNIAKSPSIWMLKPHGDNILVCAT